MAFKIEAARSGAGRRKPRLSIAAAPYQVIFTNGKRQMLGGLREVYTAHSRVSVESIFDRHKKAYLDLNVLWHTHRRKFLAKR
jgi:hypothetical protein